MLLQIGNQFLEQRIAVWSVVGGIHCVRIVEVWRRMLERDRNHAREIVAAPVLVELVARLPAPAAIRRWPLAEPERGVQTEMTLYIYPRILLAGMLVVTLRQQHRRAQIDRMSPELCEHGALYLDVLHPRGVGRQLDRWNYLTGLQFYVVSGRRVQMDLANLAIQIARRPREVLALPFVHVGPHHVAVGTMELRVDIDYGLHVVIACRNLLQTARRVSRRGAIHDRRNHRLELVDVACEERCLSSPGADLLDGFRRLRLGERDEHAARNGSGMCRGRE